MKRGVGVGAGASSGYDDTSFGISIGAGAGAGGNDEDEDDHLTMSASRFRARPRPIPSDYDGRVELTFAAASAASGGLGEGVGPTADPSATQAPNTFGLEIDQVYRCTPAADAFEALKEHVPIIPGPSIGSAGYMEPMSELGTLRHVNGLVVKTLFDAWTSGGLQGALAPQLVQLPGGNVDAVPDGTCANRIMNFIETGLAVESCEHLAEMWMGPRNRGGGFLRYMHWTKENSEVGVDPQSVSVLIMGAKQLGSIWGAGCPSASKVGFVLRSVLPWELRFENLPTNESEARARALWTKGAKYLKRVHDLFFQLYRAAPAHMKPVWYKTAREFADSLRLPPMFIPYCDGKRDSFHSHHILYALFCGVVSGEILPLGTSLSWDHTYANAKALMFEPFTSSDYIYTYMTPTTELQAHVRAVYQQDHIYYRGTEDGGGGGGSDDGTGVALRKGLGWVGGPAGSVRLRAACRPSVALATAIRTVGPEGVVLVEGAFLIDDLVVQGMVSSLAPAGVAAAGFASPGLFPLSAKLRMNNLADLSGAAKTLITAFAERNTIYAVGSPEHQGFIAAADGATVALVPNAPDPDDSFVCFCGAGLWGAGGRVVGGRAPPTGAVVRNAMVARMSTSTWLSAVDSLMVLFGFAEVNFNQGLAFAANAAALPAVGAFVKAVLQSSVARLGNAAQRTRDVVLDPRFAVALRAAGMAAEVSSLARGHRGPFAPGTNFSVEQKYVETLFVLLKNLVHRDAILVRDPELQLGLLECLTMYFVALARLGFGLQPLEFLYGCGICKRVDIRAVERGSDAVVGGMYSWDFAMNMLGASHVYMGALPVLGGAFGLAGAAVNVDREMLGVVGRIGNRLAMPAGLAPVDEDRYELGIEGWFVLTRLTMRRKNARLTPAWKTWVDTVKLMEQYAKASFGAWGAVRDGHNGDAEVVVTRAIVNDAAESLLCVL